MTWIFEALEATALAEHLRVSRWTYPLVNAGHVLGLALLVGAVVPMDVSVLRDRRTGAAAIRLLRPYAVAGGVLAVCCGALLFLAQATEYVESRWFLAKMLCLAAALLNALWHISADPLPRRAATASLILWPAVLPCGRMIGYG